MYSINLSIKQSFFNIAIAQSLSIKMLYHTLIKDQNLAKNIILLSYPTLSDLKDLFQSFHRDNQFLKFGVIRAAINIDIEQRENKKQNQLKAFYQIYGKSGVHVDVDYYQSIKQLLQRLHIQWSPCEQIHQNTYPKSIRKGISLLNNYLGIYRSRVGLFVDHLICQAYQSSIQKYTKAHQIFMEQGFQASSLKYIMNKQLSDQKLIEYSEKIAKLSYSFGKQYSMQEDHLHSSSTLFYPINNHYFISLVGTIYAGVILVIVGAVNIMGYLIENNHKVQSKLSILNLVEITIFMMEYKTSSKMDYSLIYIILKALIKLIFELLKLMRKRWRAIRNKKEKILRQKSICIQYLIMNGMLGNDKFQYRQKQQYLVMLSLYYSIFNFSLFYLTSLVCCLLLSKNILLNYIIIMNLLGLFLNHYYLNQVLYLNKQNHFSFNILEVINSLFYHVSNYSFQFKFILLLYLYPISTFLP